MYTKQIFISTGLFLDNEFLQQYIDIINDSVQYVKFKTAKHHVLPVSYYKLINESINNDKDNLVYLYHDKHILAHYYLALCTKEPLKEKMVYAFNFMYNESINNCLPEYKEILENLDSLSSLKQELCKYNSINNSNKTLSEEHKRKIPATFKANHGVNSPAQLPGVGKKISASKKGVCTITDYQREKLKESNKRNIGKKHSEETKIKISNTLKGHSVSEETKRKISETCKKYEAPCKGRRGINNGSIYIMVPLEDLESLLREG